MPYSSKKQQRWAHSPAGEEALTKKEIKEFDSSTDFESLPEEAQAGKGPTRRQGSGQKEPQISKDLKRVSREVNRDMKKGGFHSSPKGDKGYSRKEKHRTDHTVGEELTPVDETYRGVGFPIAELNWSISEKILSWPETYHSIKVSMGSEQDDFPPGTSMEEMERQDPSVPIPVKDTPGFPPTKEGGGNVPNKPAAWGFAAIEEACNFASLEEACHIAWEDGYEAGSLVAADMSWSTHKSETFDDDGEDGKVSSWGLKSIIDRGVQPHEKGSGAKRIEDAENQTQKRDIPSNKFKAYSMMEAFDW